MKLPNFLVIGSFSRDSGKTQFSRKIISNTKQDIIALKVTIIKNAENCPRGENGCGVCTSLNSNYELIEEKNIDGKKDTSKLLISGAKSVYWLRVKEDSVQEGLNAFLQITNPSIPVICESNSIMKTISPAVFILLKSTTGKGVKQSAIDIESKADMIIGTTPESFNFNFSDLSFGSSGWALKRDAAAIILIGGKSRRMGRDKNRLPVFSKPMMSHIFDQLEPFFKQIIISSSTGVSIQDKNYDIVYDKTEGCGPISGITTALKYSRFNNNFIIPCDNPEPDLEIINKMLSSIDTADAIVLKNKGKFHEPLFAVYTKKMIPVFEKLISEENFKISSAFPLVDFKYYEPEEEIILLNINTRKDYEDYLDDLEGKTIELK